MSKEDLNRLYQQAEAAVWTYDPEKRPDWTLAKKVLSESQLSGKLLDVGCFDGGFLRYVVESSSDWVPYGVELNVEAALRAKGHGIEMVGSDADHVEGIGTYDAVVSFDVIEHLTDPSAFLKSLTQLVRPGGLIMISTGNVDAPSWKLMGSRYWYCALAEHLSFISPAWCRKISHDLGLNVERIHTFSHEQNRSVPLRLAEAAKNMIYRILPSLFKKLRQRGMGGVDIQANPELADTPPIWISAEDQFMVVFKKL
ncbi:class I SAM-dependent methyltransferase [bacterium]|nr:class I SAM-dependent methyltransferase [bacterium]